MENAAPSEPIIAQAPFDSWICSSTEYSEKSIILLRAMKYESGSYIIFDNCKCYNIGNIITNTSFINYSNIINTIDNTIYQEPNNMEFYFKDNLSNVDIINKASVTSPIVNIIESSVGLEVLPNFKL